MYICYKHIAVYNYIIYTIYNNDVNSNNQEIKVKYFKAARLKWLCVTVLGMFSYLDHIKIILIHSHLWLNMLIKNMESAIY